MTRGPAQLTVGALHGLKVIDVSQTRVGAQVSQVFADFGADVLWVEPPHGSALREQAGFPFWARGKQSIELDLKEAAGRDAVLDVARVADVFIETFRPGVADRLGLGFEELSANNPRLVYASITGFGRSGPYAAVKGYEGLVMAKLGVNAAFDAMTRGTRPPFVTAPWCSFSASQTALHGVLAALFERERSGLGQHVEANLVQGFAALDTWAWFLHLIATRWPDAYQPVEVVDDQGVPASPFPYMLLSPLTKDGRWLQFAQVRPHLFVALMRALDLEWMLTDPAWAGIPVFDDVERRLGLWEKMLEAAGSKTLAEWQAIFDADPDVFAELFRNGPEVLDHPQLVHDRQVVEIDQPGVGIVRQPGPLVRMERTPATVGRPAPRLGEHHADTARDGERLAHAVAAGDTPDELPLAGVTVLELAVLYAAPYGATLLADLGARIIKVEPLDGDPIRTILPFPEAGGAKVMQGKDSVCIDLSTPEGLALVHELARRSDLVLQGFRAGAAERLGIDASTLHSLNPDLVYLSAPGYGTGPPSGQRPSFAPSIGAAGGIALANLGGTVPERAGLDLDQVRDGAIRLSGAGTQTIAQADGFAALGVATSLLLGLLARERGAGGQAMVASMLSTVTHAMSAHVVDSPGTVAPAPDHEMRGLGARYRVYDAADGWVFLAAPYEDEWVPLVDALAPHVDLAEDGRFTTEDDRRRNDAELTEVLAAVFARGAKDVWERDLLRADVGCVAVTTETVETMWWSDSFSRAAGYVTDVEHPIFETHPRLAPLVRFSRSRTRAQPGVLAGSATDAVLGELGYSDARIADLRERRIVR